MREKPILCIDFDGVLHSYMSGWKGFGRCDDPPMPGALEFLHEATRFFRVAVYSSRSKSLRGRAAMYAPPNERDLRWRDAIIGRLIVEGAQDASDSELERCLSPCVCGPALIEAAKRLRDTGNLPYELPYE